jgi:hypothetical protein
MNDRKKLEDVDTAQSRRRVLAEANSATGSVDICISLRHIGEDVTGVSRMEIFYSSGGMRTVLEFDRIHPRYAGNSLAMLDDAIRHLMSEIKFRLRSQIKFGIWYNSFFDQDIVEAVALDMAKADSSLGSLAERLFELGKQRSEELGEV